MRRLVASLVLGTIVLVAVGCKGSSSNKAAGRSRKASDASIWDLTVDHPFASPKGTDSHDSKQHADAHVGATALSDAWKKKEDGGRRRERGVR
jgi:hypothetical protein